MSSLYKGLELTVWSLLSQLYLMESGYTKSSLLFLLCLLRCSLQIGDCLLLCFVELFCLWVRVRPSISQNESWRVFTLVLEEQGFPIICGACGSWSLPELACHCWAVLSPTDLASPTEVQPCCLAVLGSFLLNLILSTDQWRVALGKRGAKWGQSLWCCHLLLYLVKAPWGISCLEKRAGGRRCTKTNSAFQEMRAMAMLGRS